MFAYALIDTNTFDMMSMSLESHGYISNPNIVEIKVNDDRYINSLLHGRLQLPKLFYKTHYPAFMGTNDVLSYRKMMCKVPENGIVVEVGSAYGGTAAIAAEIIADKNITYYCIDRGWKTSDHSELQYIQNPKFLEYLKINHNFERFDSMYDFTKDYLSKWTHIKFIPADCPYDIKDWDIEIDYLFEDSVHANPQLSDNLNFWLPFVKKGGIISGHDIDDLRFPDIRLEAEKLASRLNQTLNITSNIWWMVNNDRSYK